MSRALKITTLLSIFIIASTYTPKSNNNKSYIFPIQNIKIENNDAVEKSKLKEKLNYLLGKSLMFIEQEKLNEIIMNFDFISNYKVKKIYPNSIKIIVFEENPVAIYIEGQNKHYITEKEKFIKYKKLSQYEDLPLVFGKNIKFNNFFINIRKTNFPIDEIKSFRYYDIGRWDIILKNDKLIKLPSQSYINSLKKYLLLKNDKNFEKYKTFDYRIKNQLILN